MNDWKAEAEARRAAIAATLESLKLTVESRFVPFSQSRNKAEKHKSLNWIVTVKRNGRDVLSTDYSAGVAHCPSYGVKVSPHWNRPAKYWRDEIVDFETESGFKARGFTSWGGFTADKTKPIKPDPVDVLYSLTMDSGVLDYAGFEDWASEYGYDTDSRQAENVYHACLEIALKLRADIGEAGLETLKTAYQDF